MTQYRKKPVVVEAWKWNFTPSQEPAPQWATNAMSVWPRPGGIAFWPHGNNGCGDPAWAEKTHIVIETPEGTMIAEPGDWIIRGVKGELYPCKPDIFEATYEDASAPAVDYLEIARLGVVFHRKLMADWAAPRSEGRDTFKASDAFAKAYMNHWPEIERKSTDSTTETD